MQSSKLPVRKWIVAIYLIAVNPKGVSSVRLAELLGVTQNTAWHLMQKIREGFSPEDLVKLRGVVEVDETYIGGKEKNKHWDKKQRSGRGPIGKMAVIGAKQRNGNVIAMLIENTDTQTLEQFISDHIQEGSVICTDDHPGYRNLHHSYEHLTVSHSNGQYVDGLAHTNSIESFWATIKRAIYGTYHNISRKHLQRYINEFTAKANMAKQTIINKIETIARNLIGKQLTYQQLTS